MIDALVQITLWLVFLGLFLSFVVFVFLAVYTPGNDVWGDMAVAAGILTCLFGWFVAEVLDA